MFSTWGEKSSTYNPATAVEIILNYQATSGQKHN